MALSPPRRVALVLGLLFTLATIAFASLAVLQLLGRATYQQQLVLPSPGTRLLVVDSGVGSVRIHAGEDDLVHARAVVHYSLTRPSITHTSGSGGVVLGSSCRGWFNLGACWVDYDIAAPPDFALQVSTGAGRITTGDGFTGVMTLRTSNGAITVTGASGILDLRTGAGTVSATGLRASSVEATTGAGDIDVRFEAAPQRLVAQSGAGDIDAAVPTTVAYRVQAETGAGRRSVTVPIDATAARSVVLHSGAGNVTLRPSAG